jgi:hypothetical protein
MQRLVGNRAVQGYLADRRRRTRNRSYPKAVERAPNGLSAPYVQRADAAKRRIEATGKRLSKKLTELDARWFDAHNSFS